MNIKKLFKNFLICYFTFTASSYQAIQYSNKANLKTQIYLLLPLRLFYYLYLFIMSARLTTYSIFIDKYLVFDHSLALINSLSRNRFAGIFIVPFLLLCFFFDFFVKVKTNIKVASILVELIVINTNENANFSIYEQFSSSLYYLTKYRFFWNNSQVNVYFQKLIHYKSFSEITRIKVAFIELISELYICTTFLFSMILIFVMCFYLVAMTFKVDLFFFYQLHKLMILVDTFMLFCLFNNIFNVSFFVLKAILLVTYSWCIHINEVTYKTFWQMNVYFKYNKFKYFQLKIICTNFIKQHSQILVDLIEFNCHFASTLIFWLYLPNIAANIYCISLLYFVHMGWFVKWCLNIILFAQFMSFFTLSLLPKLQKALYSADKAIYQAQSKIFFYLPEKLKLMTYYELLRTNDPFVYNFGNYTKITNRCLFEVIVKKVYNFDYKLMFCLFFSFYFFMHLL